MKGTNWGRIAARLTAVLVLTRAFDYTYQVVERYVEAEEYGLYGNSVYLVGYSVYDVFRIVIAVVLL